MYVLRENIKKIKFFAMKFSFFLLKKISVWASFHNGLYKRVEKHGIKLTTNGLKGKWLIHNAMEASPIQNRSRYDITKLKNDKHTSPVSVMVRAYALKAGGCGFYPRPHHNKDVRNGTSSSRYLAWRSAL